MLLKRSSDVLFISGVCDSGAVVWWNENHGLSALQQVLWPTGEKKYMYRKISNIRRTEFQK